VHLGIEELAKGYSDLERYQYIAGSGSKWSRSIIRDTNTGCCQKENNE